MFARAYSDTNTRACEWIYFSVGSTTIRFDVRDNCNRLGRCQFVITVVDSQLPSIECPINDVVVCTDEGECTWLADDSTDPTVSENCDGLLDVDYRISGVTIASNTGAGFNFVKYDDIRFNIGTSEIGYRIEDEARNFVSCFFNVVVEDCEDPVLSCPDDLTIECDADDKATALTTWLATASATDNCGDIELSNLVFNTISGCGNTNTEVYQFTATDDDGNEAQCFASFEIVDNVPPIITEAAADRVSDCANADTDLLDWLNNNGGAEANDLCGAVSWSHNFVGGPISGCSDGTTRYDSIQRGGLIDNSTWTLGDGSDLGYNSIGQDSENNRVNDIDPFGNNAIVWEAGNDASSGADGGWNTSTFPIDNTKLYRFSTWVNRKELGADGRAYLGVYGYGSVNGVKRVSDNATETNPYFWVSASPPNMINEDEWALVVGHVYPHNYTSTTDHPDSGIYTVANDRIGNTNLDFKWLPQTTSALHRNYLFYSTDTDVRQQFIYPRVDCVDGSEPSIDDLRDGYDARPILDDDITSSIRVTFTATDDCGNTSISRATFNVEDTGAPTLDCPSDITLECGDALNDAVMGLWLDSATATDNCTDVTITNDYTDTFVADCGTTGTHTVTFTATDECELSSTCITTIKIEDTTAPVFLIKPQDLIVECGDGAADPSAWIKAMGGAMAEDQCDIDLIWDVKEGDKTEGCGDSESITYAFIVTDDCGNSVSATAEYVFEDTTEPIVVPPKDIIVECGDTGATSIKDWQSGASATDNCGEGFSFEAILFNTISGCGDSFTEVYQFTAIDACGNEGTALASIQLQILRSLK